MSKEFASKRSGIYQLVSKSPILFIVGVYLLSCVIAGVLAPYLFNVICDLSTKFNIAGLQKVCNRGLGIVFERIRLFAVICAIPLLYKAIKNYKISSGIFDKSYIQNKIYSFVQNAFVGIFLISVVYFIYNFDKIFGCECGEIKYNFGVCKVVLFAVRALFVACVEEFLFRNLLVRLIYNKYSKLFTIVVSSLIFAYLHFRIPTELCKFSHAATLSDGVNHAFLSMFAVWKYIDCTKCVVLFLLGTLLSQMVFYYKSIVPSIGFHFGIVFILFIIRAIVINEISLYLTHEVFNSWIIIVLLIVINLIYIYKIKFGNCG